MKTEQQKTGRYGEDLTCQFYENQHYRIVERNWKCYHLEVDLIVENDDYLVFCEVKTRSSTVFGEPETFVTPEKQRNIIKAANIYVRNKGIEKEVRCDVVSIIICGEQHQLHFLPDAFKPKW